MISPSTQPENYKQLILHSFRLYRHAFPHVFLLSLLLSTIAFIPRLFSVIIGQDIFLTLPPFSLQRYWLTLVDLGALIFFTAMLWRIHCYMIGAHESMIDDMKIALRKIPYIFIAAVLQTLLVLGILFFFVMLIFSFWFREGQFITATGIGDQLTLSLIFMSQFFLVFYIFILFYFYLPIILIEEKGVFHALAKSAELVWKNGWRTLSVQLTPWIAYLFCILFIKYVFNINIHVFFIQAQDQQAFTATILHIILFALFIPWVGTNLILQLRDLELRKNKIT